MKNLIYTAVVLLCATWVVAENQTYFVNSEIGKDTNCGTSRAKPWASLEKVNAMTFGPGDQILFKAGSVYKGQLKLQGSGAKGHPVVIDKYGTGSKPRIDGEGKVLDTVLLENIEYWEVNNLEITNLGPERKPWQTGIKVWANNYGTVHHIQFKNLYVHDVNGDLNKDTEGCGIFAQCSGEILSNFDGLLIEDCHVVRTDRNGICMNSDFTDRSKNWFPSYHVVIRGNLVEDCGGDCIKPWGTVGCVVEYNTVHYGRQRCTDYAAGIWPWSADDTLIQYNEVSHIKGTMDGQAFDSDYNCNNTTFQYNYSHDNDGGFMLMCTPKITENNVGCNGTVVRYNISQNDLERVFQINGQVKNTRVYNNIVYVKEGIDIPLLMFANVKGYAIDLEFYNNIFYADGKLHYAHSTKWLKEGKHSWAPGFNGADVKFSNNVFYGNHVQPPEDPKAITADPMLVNPGSGQNGFDTLGGYQLKAGSPCIAAGKAIEESGVLDFWSNQLEGNNPSVGVHEWTAE
jgi:hypothetical protein